MKDEEYLDEQFPKGETKFRGQAMVLLALARQVGQKAERKRILELIDEFSNPYPKDIFLWDNKEKLDFNRGRFNQHCFEIVENIREALKKQVEK